MLDQLLQDEIQGMDSTSKILMSNADTTSRLLERYEEFNEGPALPSIVIAEELTESTTLDQLSVRQQSAARIVSLENLGAKELTHAFLHIHTSRSEQDIHLLLREVYDSLATNGKLFVSRRKRDGLAEILHASVVEVPGRKSNAELLQDRLAAIATEVGFLNTNMRSLEKSYLVSNDELVSFLGHLRTTLAVELDPCEPGSGWRADFDDAADSETTEHGGVLLIADVLMATKVA